ncbi:recombinase family protein, partial [Chloroflexota bacterium]
VTINILTQRAVGYLRVSTSKQTGERHSSLETQAFRFKEYCQRNNYVAITTYTDIVTGRRDDRKQYRSMVEFVKQGGADVIVVQFLDRFGRNPREILRRYWELEEYGVKVVATDEDIGEELILLVKAGVAGAESRRTSERVKSNMSRAVAKGVHAAKPPYGLRPLRLIKNGEMNVTWELDPIEYPIVRDMFRLAIEENLGFKAIGDRLSSLGHNAREGRPFAAYTIQKILTNPAIAGTLVYGRKPRKGNPKIDLIEIPNFFPSILAQEEWQELQNRLKIRRENPKGRTQSSVYLLSGIARCGHCGGPMVGKVGGSYKGKRYRNYYCSRALRSRKMCSFYNGHSVLKLEKVILDYLGKFSDQETVRKYLEAAAKSEISRYESELKDIEKRLNKYNQKFLHQLDLLQRGLINEEEFRQANEANREHSKFNEERKTELLAWLSRQHSTALQVEKVPKEVNAFINTFQTLDIGQQKVHLQSILKAAHIHRDGRIEMEFRE